MVLEAIIGVLLVAGVTPDSGVCQVTVTAILDDQESLPGVELLLREDKGVINFSASEPNLETAITGADGQVVLNVPKGIEAYVIASFPGLHSTHSNLSCETDTASVRLDTPIDVSLVQLIANPDEWNGRIVRVIGFLNLEFEGDAVYLHREDWRRGISRNGIWVDGRTASATISEKLSGEYVLIQGRFDATRHGHMSLFSGEITEITRCERWKW